MNRRTSPTDAEWKRGAAEENQLKAPPVKKLSVRSAEAKPQAMFEAVEDQAVIPETLAALTLRIIAFHRANGDIGWLSDMIVEAENAETVPDAAACPVCHENAIDNLGWNRDGEEVECTTCGHVYNLGARK